MEKAIKYPNILKEYFMVYKNRFAQSIVCLLFLCGIFLPTVIKNAKTGAGYMWVMLPMMLALFSGMTHTCEMPPLFYLLPGTKTLRESYFKRMLQVEIALPMILCILVDVFVLYQQNSMIKAVILQLASVFFTTYCIGIANDGGGWRNTAKAAYGQMGFFNGAITVVSILVACIMIQVCSAPVGNTEFYVVAVLFVLIYVPLSYAVHRRWRGIREKLAVYELATKEETW